MHSHLSIRNLLSKVRQIVTTFVCNFKPTAAWSTITTPRHRGGLGVIDPAVQFQAFQLKHLRNAVSSTVSWGKDIALDIIQWRTRSMHRLAFVVAPGDIPYRSMLAGFPSLQRMVAAATKLPSLKTSITQASPPDSSTFAASPVEWWFPPADNTTPPLTTRIGDLFLLTANENNKYRVSNKPELPSKLRQEQDSLVSQLVQAKTRNMSQAYLTVIQDPPAGLVGDQIQQRVQSIVLYGEGKSTVTFGSAATKQLRHFLSSPPSTASAPPPTESTSRSEEGSVTQWRKFWRTKIPHRARTIWWRYKRDILPCGTLRAHRWNQDPKCEMRGCREQSADKNHYIFQCSAKYLAWQSILKEYTDKPLWSDEDLHSLLSFKPPKFSIKPEYNISAPQLLACSDDDLKRDISTQLGVQYLSESTPAQSEMKCNRGVVWGVNNHAKPVNVHFLVDTGTPVTYICRKALRGLGAAESDIEKDGFTWAMSVNGVNLKVAMSPLDKHFPDINLLGSDFLVTARCILTVNYVAKTCVVELGARHAPQ
ncbi:hypothetical protein K457DRAFT_36828 [Linnemannia elongata AG-77]|uniref:Uncharacterized protein n=1 Tax=Linnemannia elongata AG-77 TaxID=1314771 RepID=A0A197JDD9_9FUNG|nr:hypothetical protein K457DRAFT_36828 [Linnemannia elongata AG-77]